MQEIGHAALAIIPSFDGFGSKLERGTAKEMLAAGDKGGRAFGDAAGKSAGDRFKSHVKTAAKAAALGIAAASAFAIKFAGDSLEEAREAQKIGAQTQAVIKSTGSAAKVTEKDIGRLTGRLSDMAGVDDELIQNGANVLLTFTKVRNEAGKGSNIFDRATKSALNMSTALGSDLKGASLQVGKALNDPIKGVTALARAGVQFTSIQKAQITALVEGGSANAAVATGLVADTKMFNDLVKAQDGDIGKVVDTLTNKLTPAQKKTFDMYREGGHTLDAQKRILKELDTQFAGSAKAQATDSDKLKVAYGNLKEEVGTALIPVMDDLANVLRKKGIPAARDFFGWVKDTGVPAVKDLYEQSKPALKIVKDLVGAFGDLPTSDKLAAFGGALAGGVTVKHQIAKVFERGGIANPMFVTVTNAGFGAGAGGVGGATTTAGAAGAAGWGARAATAFRAGLFKASIVLSTITVADMILPNASDNKILDPIGDGSRKAGDWVRGKFGNKNTTQTQANGERNPFASIYQGDPKDISKKIDTALDLSRAKAAGLGTELDLVGSRKIDPTIKRESIDRANAALATFIGKQIDAGRPVTPYINTTDIERAIGVARTLNDTLRNQADVGRGADGGVNYQHGGTGTASPRAGITIERMDVHGVSLDDALRDGQKRTQRKGLGGRP